MDTCYHIHHPEAIFSPSLVLFRELLEQNIARMLEIAGSAERLRPHCKTHKMREVVRLQQNQGITKQKAATLAECEMLAQTGCRDILLSYNLVGPNIHRAVEFLRRYPEVQFAATADDTAMVEALATALQDAGLSMAVLLDINPGRDRTGLPCGEQAAALYDQIARTPGIEPGGFHLYDGHQHQRDLAERRAAVHQEWQRVAAFRDKLTAQGLPVPRIVCGGTPTFPVYAELDDPAIELSPGTCLFHDTGYGENFPDITGFTPAELLLTRVISRPTPNRITFDCGTKSVATDPPMGNRMFFPDLPDAVQVLHNEEHLVVETDQAASWKPGDWTLAIPRHVCPTTALHKEVTVIENGQIVDHWTVASRDRQLTI